MVDGKIAPILILRKKLSSANTTPNMASINLSKRMRLYWSTVASHKHALALSENSIQIFVFPVYYFSLNCPECCVLLKTEAWNKSTSFLHIKRTTLRQHMDCQPAHSYGT